MIIKYAVEAIVNGNFTIHSEHGTDLKAAIMEWHAYCRALWNDAQTQEATVKIIDSQGNLVTGYNEFIKPVVTPAE